MELHASVLPAAQHRVLLRVLSLIDCWINVLGPKVRPEAVWTVGFNLKPDLKAFNMKEVIALSWEPLNSLVCLEWLQTDVALVVTQVAVPFKENDSLYLAEILVVV